MRIIPNWRRVLVHAWSVRLMVLAAIFSGLEVALPLLDGFIDIEPRVFAVMSGVTVAAAFVLRFKAQKGLTYGDEQASEDSSGGRSNGGGPEHRGSDQALGR